LLNTLPPSIPSPLLPRRRGGQPANHNALRHGLHARQHLAPFASLAHAVPASQPALFADSEAFNRAILALRQQIAALFQASQNTAGLRSILPWHRAILYGITLLKQIMKARQRCLQPQQHLQFIAAHALDLIRHDFRSSGITRDAYSFRGKCEKSDLNSPASQENASQSLSGFPYLFLTPRQCQILASLLPPSSLSQNPSFYSESSALPAPVPHLCRQAQASGGPVLSIVEGSSSRCSSDVSRPAVEGQDGEIHPGRELPSPNVYLYLGRGGGRGRPPASLLPLLNAIFWKITLHARWQDLPAGSPPMLTCRRYYRRLFRSGRLLTLYSALYQDLLTRGQTDLTTLVDQGCFSLAGDQITLRPGLKLTWQLRTALLFMQLACQVSIRILRKSDRCHRSLFPLTLKPLIPSSPNP